MKFAHFSHVWNKPGMTAAQRYEQLWRELTTCDELGFDFGFTVEHHFNPNESWMPSPSIYCTGAAARTRKMRHGPMGFVVSALRSFANRRGCRGLRQRTERTLGAWSGVGDRA